eukprot:603770-Rhodomonas_salina.2
MLGGSSSFSLWLPSRRSDSAFSAGRRIAHTLHGSLEGGACTVERVVQHLVAEHPTSVLRLADFRTRTNVNARHRTDEWERATSA